MLVSLSTPKLHCAVLPLPNPDVQNIEPALGAGVVPLAVACLVVGRSEKELRLGCGLALLALSRITDYGHYSSLP
jgi:hypothetical protein